MLAEGGTQRLALRRKPLEFGPRVIENPPHVVPRGRESVPHVAEIVRGKKIDRFGRVVRIANAACRTHLGGQHQKVAPRLQQNTPDVGACRRNNVTSFAVGGGKHLLAHSGEISRLFPPGVPLGAVVVNQRRNVGRSRLVVLWVIWAIHLNGDT